MTNKEIVSVQWNRLKEEMVQLMNTQINNTGQIKYADLNRTFKSKLQRWSNMMSPEGRWMDGQTDAIRIEKMLHKLSGLNLEEVTSVRNSSNLMPGLLVGGACILVGSVLSFPLPVSIVAGVVAFGLMNKQSKKNQKKELMKAKETYIAQIVKYGEMISDIWEE